MSELHISWEEYHKKTEQLAVKVHEDGWNFNQVVCIAKGGMRVGDIFARLFNIKNPMITVDMIRMAEKRMFFSSEKAKKELNYKYKTAKSAINDAIKWVIDNGYCRNVNLV